MVELIYYADHAERYAHMSEEEREDYPDEVRMGYEVFKRTKLYAELTKEDLGGSLDPFLIAKDLPVSKAFIH